MLTKRIIPCLDIDKGRVVKGTQFLNIRDAGDPLELANFYYQEGADEIVFLDITASHEDRDIVLDLAEKIAKKIFIPFTIGGGVNSPEKMAEILRRGADKVAVNTAAVKNPKIITKCAERFGSQAVVAAVDAKKVGDSWNVFIYGGRENTGIDVIEWTKELAKLGAGEILLTSMDRDGEKSGYDLELLKTVSEKVNIPLIASGGAGTLEHLLDGLKIGKADAVLAASIFHFGKYSIRECKEFLRGNKVSIRKI